MGMSPDESVPLLEVRNLSKNFADPTSGKDRPVLVDLNFSVRPGEVVGLIGGSGTGKTTLLRLVAALDQPTCGAIRWHTDGADVQVAMLFQDYGRSLFPWLDVNAQLRLALAPLGLDRATCSARIAQVLEVTGLSAYRGYLPRELSGGMQQRVAFARALLQDPVILLLDEPFGSLDSFTRMRLEDHVLEVASRMHLSILLVTHDVEEAVYMSDRVIAISGTPARITRSVEISLQRPRSMHTRVTPEFAALKADVLSAVHVTS